MEEYEDIRSIGVFWTNGGIKPTKATIKYKDYTKLPDREIVISSNCIEWNIIQKLDKEIGVAVDDNNRIVSINSVKYDFIFVWEDDYISLVDMIDSEDVISTARVKTYYDRGGNKLRKIKKCLDPTIDFVNTETVYNYDQDGKLTSKTTTYDYQKAQKIGYVE